MNPLPMNLHPASVILFFFFLLVRFRVIVIKVCPDVSHVTCRTNVMHGHYTTTMWFVHTGSVLLLVGGGVELLLRVVGMFYGLFCLHNSTQFSSDRKWRENDKKDNSHNLIKAWRSMGGGEPPYFIAINGDQRSWWAQFMHTRPLQWISMVRQGPTMATRPLWRNI